MVKPQVFINEEEIKKKILALTPGEARKLGVKHISTLKRMKDRIKKGKLNLETELHKKVS